MKLKVSQIRVEKAEANSHCRNADKMCLTECAALLFLLSRGRFLLRLKLRRTSLLQLRCGPPPPRLRRTRPRVKIRHRHWGKAEVRLCQGYGGCDVL